MKSPNGEVCIENALFTLIFCVLFFTIACQLSLGSFLLIEKRKIETGQDYSFLNSNTVRQGGDIETKEVKSLGPHVHDESEESSSEDDDIDI